MPGKARARSESPIEHWIGTALAGVVLAKVALPRRHSHNSDSDNSGSQKALSVSDDHGRLADTPSEIPAEGWKDVAWRVSKEAKDDSLPLLAAGVTYYA